MVNHIIANAINVMDVVHHLLVNAISAQSLPNMRHHGIRSLRSCSFVGADRDREKERVGTPTPEVDDQVLKTNSSDGVLNNDNGNGISMSGIDNMSAGINSSQD